MKSIKTVLLIEDNPGDARLLREMFYAHDKHDSELRHVSCMADAEKYLSEHAVDAILLDLGLPDAQGLEAVRRGHAAAPGVPLVVLTGLDDETLASQALQDGAQDYLIKGEIEVHGLLRALRYASERKRLERVKDEFVSSVSHELRTPLTSIRASLGLVMSKAGGALPEPTRHLLEIAYSNCERLVRLVNDILDVEKMESGQVVFNFERVEVRALVEQAVEAHRGFAESHGVRIRLEDDAGAVDAVRSDPHRLFQVVSNLLSNAIKFSPPNGEVVVARENGTAEVRITVRDQGSGIPETFKPHIFERFSQADGTNAGRKGGTGLGLSIVKQLVQRLGGNVSFIDAPGGGTVFQVALPRWQDDSTTATGIEAQVDALKRVRDEAGRDAPPAKPGGAQKGNTLSA